MSWNRILSGIVAAAYLTGAYSYGGEELFFAVAAFLILPLACIWFSEAMGDYTGLFPGPGRPSISQPTPSGVVCFGGWLILLLPIIALLITRWVWR